MVRSLITWAVNNPLIVVLFALALAGFGSYAFLEVNVEAYPDPAPAIIEVVAQFPGASAEEVERQVTIPLEVTLAGMPGLRQLTLSRIPKLTDACLRTLGRMTQLRELSLRCTGKMTDTGLATLAGLKQLESLELDYARNLTGSRLLKLTRALPLRELVVAECPHVGDDDVLALTRHPTLEKVRFLGCKNITVAGRAAVHEVRPDWVL